MVHLQQRGAKPRTLKSGLEYQCAGRPIILQYLRKQASGHRECPGANQKIHSQGRQDSVLF